MVAGLATLPNGFADPVFQSQAVFRKVLDALACPARPVALEMNVEAPSSLSSAQAAVLLTLADQETPVWLSPSCNTETTQVWVRFRCNAPLAVAPDKASFAVMTVEDLGAMQTGISAFAQGTLSYPDRSETLLVEVPDLSGGPILRATGPGIEREARLSPRGLPDGIVGGQWAQNQARFPCGVDLILTCNNRILGLPRTIQLTRS